MNSVPFWFVAFYVFVFGLCFGSFLNVAALRGLSGEDMVLARSKCPKCKNKLKWYMNIPLVSYIFLRGKCGFCKAPISIQYPLVELFTGLIFLAVYFCWGLTLKSAFLCIISCLFILLALTDILETVILDYHAYILTAVGIIYSLFDFSGITLVQSIIGAVTGFLVFEIMSKIGEFLVKMRMFGEGDSLIAMALGAVFGLKVLLIIVALSFFVQTITAIPVLVFNSIKNKNHKLTFTYLSIFFSILALFLLNYFNVSDDLKLYTAIVIFIAIILLFALKNMILEIAGKRKEIAKNDSFEQKLAKSNYNIMPFGPALIISAFLSLFCIDIIKDIIVKLMF